MIQHMVFLSSSLSPHPDRATRDSALRARDFQEPDEADGNDR